jgi:hypothetical protein
LASTTALRTSHHRSESLRVEDRAMYHITSPRGHHRS